MIDRNQCIFSYFETPHEGDGSVFQGTEFPLLERQLQMLEKATGLYASFHDLTGITSLVKELALRREYRSHRSDYCAAIKNSGLFQQCVRCKYVTNFLARKKKAAFTGVCHVGVWDLVYPVYYEDTFLGTVFIGSANCSSPRRFQPCSAQYQALPKARNLNLPQLKEYAKVISELIVCTLRSHGISPQFLKTIRRRSHKLETEPAHWLVRRAMKWIEEHYNEPLSLSHISKELKVKSQYLCRLFSEKQGISLTQFIHQVRIRHAKEMLLTGRYNVTEVAVRTGFDDPSYFTRIFHKLEKKSPSEFLVARV